MDATKKTYNTRDSLVVTDPTTSLALTGLSMGERTGSRAFQWVWSYVFVEVGNGGYGDGLGSTPMFLPVFNNLPLEHHWHIERKRLPQSISSASKRPGNTRQHPGHQKRKLDPSLNCQTPDISPGPGDNPKAYRRMSDTPTRHHINVPPPPPPPTLPGPLSPRTTSRGFRRLVLSRAPG
ncbi:hypothetical protein B0T18DRAFT_330832 [Schizothecium vesticola]|uniref:Uncharacterized protein n=1 Tax=Schizothecium vesticola TaxID=314040 RepID=A0AA40EL08_9PEZI|nr:hypothetical protein B0T18DRAFT_330832 [Schizothecium vesticola]